MNSARPPWWDSGRWGLLCVIAGTAIAVAVWVTVVPWDLSGLDSLDSHVNSPADRIVAGLIVVSGAYVVAAFVWPRVPVGWLSIGTSATWIAMYSWRASESSMVDEESWMEGLMVVVGPLATASTVAVWTAAFVRRSKFRP